MMISQSMGTELLWQIDLNELPVSDLTARVGDGRRGKSKWVSGDWNSKEAHAFWQHEDPDFNPFLSVMRLSAQNYGALTDLKISSSMPPLVPAGFHPYPTEAASTALAKTHGGATFGIIKQRFHKDLTKDNSTLLAKVIIPVISVQNSKVRFWYQQSGFVVAVHDSYGPVARLVLAGLHIKNAVGRASDDPFTGEQTVRYALDEARFTRMF